MLHASDSELHVSGFANECLDGGVRSCALDSAADCGCTLPAALARRAAAHPEVLFASRVEQVYPNNVFGRAIAETPDVVSWPYSLQEDGLCTDAACSLDDYLPFSRLPALYGALLNKYALPAGQERPRGKRPYEHTAAGVSTTVPRRVGRKGATDAAKAIASIPAASAAAAATGLEAELLNDTATCSVACGSSACDYGFSRCQGLTTPIMAAGLTGAGQLVHIGDTGLDSFGPYFYDPAFGAAGPAITQDLVGNVPNQTFPPITAHRKVVGACTGDQILRRRPRALRPPLTLAFIPRLYPAVSIATPHALTLSLHSTFPMRTATTTSMAAATARIRPARWPATHGALARR